MWDLVIVHSSFNSIQGTRQQRDDRSHNIGVEILSASSRQHENEQLPLRCSLQVAACGTATLQDESKKGSRKSPRLRRGRTTLDDSLHTSAVYHGRRDWLVCTWRASSDARFRIDAF